MTIKEIKGDALEVFRNTSDACLVHQVNCQGVMGSGIAKQIREEYPEHYDDYLHRLSIDKRIRTMGDYFDTFVNDEFSSRIIFGLFSQWNYGKGKHTNYAAFAQSLLNALSVAEDEGCDTMIIPKFIGCGLGGGDWSVVYPIIYDASLISSVNILIVEK